MSEAKLARIWGDTDEGYASRVAARKSTLQEREELRKKYAGRFIQTVTLTLDDGRELRFSGQAEPDIANHGIVKVSFSEPRELPNDTRLEYMDFSQPKNWK